MSPADQQAAEHFRQAITFLRCAKHSLSQGRDRLRIGPRDTRALQLAAQLLKLERELAALSEPEPAQMPLAEARA